MKFSNKTLRNIFTISSSFTIHNPFLNAHCAVRCASFWCNLFDLCQWFLQESNCRHVYYSKFTSYLLIMSKVVWNLLSCHSLLNIHKLQTKRKRHCCHFIAYWVGVFLRSKQLSRAFPLFKCQCFQSHVKVHIYFKHLKFFAFLVTRTSVLSCLLLCLMIMYSQRYLHKNWTLYCWRTGSASFLQWFVANSCATFAIKIPLILTHFLFISLNDSSLLVFLLRAVYSYIIMRHVRFNNEEIYLRISIHRIDRIDVCVGVMLISTACSCRVNVPHHCSITWGKYRWC